jgi:hypothetical protein
LFAGSLGNRALGPDGGAWTAAVNCARSLQGISKAYTDDKTDFTLAAIRKDLPTHYALRHICREIREGRGERLFRYLSEVFEEGLEQLDSVASWKAHLNVAYNEARASKKNKGRPPYLRDVAARIKLRKISVDEATIGKTLKQWGFEVRKQGEHKAAI